MRNSWMLMVKPRTWTWSAMLKMMMVPKEMESCKLLSMMTIKVVTKEMALLTKREAKAAKKAVAKAEAAKQEDSQQL